jgi:hypothetical protein
MRSTSSVLLATFLILTILPLTGCINTEPVDSRPIAADRDRVWETVQLVLVEQRGYPGFDEYEDEEGHLLTKWRFRPSVHSHEGTRHKVEVDLLPAEPPLDAETGQTRWIVRLTAYWERNEAVSNPMSWSEADWSAMGQDPQEEQIILGSIELSSRDPEDFGPSDSARRIWEQRKELRKTLEELDAEIEEHEAELERLEREGEALGGDDRTPDQTTEKP